MTPERAKEILPVFQAFAEGKTIQCLERGEWLDVERPAWSTLAKYRIKPELKQVLMTVEDLPTVVWIKGDRPLLCYAIHPDGELETEYKRGTIHDLHKQGFLWSADRKTWNSFIKLEE